MNFQGGRPKGGPGGPAAGRAMTPRGQMSGNGSGPAIMMMPPHIRATFMPNPPLKHLQVYNRRVLVADNYITDDDDDNSTDINNSKNYSKKVGPWSGLAKVSTAFPKLKKGAGISGVSSFLHHFERTAPPERKIDPTPKSIREEKIKSTKLANDIKLAPLIDKYRKEQKDCAGEFMNGMNCFNTLFVGRLAYEVTERKLLREMEVYGPVKDLKIVTDKLTGRSRGYAFVEYEHDEDMKRAFRAADGMRIEGRAIVVDVERGHTVPNWLPRKFGGGLGGTRRGSQYMNDSVSGRYDPSRVVQQQPMDQMMMGPPPGMGMGPLVGGPPPPHTGHYGGGGGRGGPPPPMMGGRGGGPPPMMGGGRYDDRGGRYGDRGGGGGGGGGNGGYYGGPPSYGSNDRGGGGYRDSRYGGGNGVGYSDRGPPPLAWERGGSGGDSYSGDRKRRRSRSRSPDRDRDRRRR